MCENVSNRCRLCLDEESVHVSLLDNPSIQLHIKSCLALVVSSTDHLPKTVCVSCVSQLAEFYHFQLNARCSQDWLESCIQQTRKSTETKAPIQPLPDSEYNSDSLLEFLNNNANIEEYLSNLGKEDIPSIVNMLDKNHENSMDTFNRLTGNLKGSKSISPKKKEQATTAKSGKINMDIDVLDSDTEIVQKLLMKEVEDTKPKVKTTEKQVINCFACKIKFENIQKLSRHLSICDDASRTCNKCLMLFDSKLKMLQHRITHVTSYPVSCNCGQSFINRYDLLHHYKNCTADFTTIQCTFRCKQCSLIFKDRLQLYRHAKSHVKKAEERICDICGHVFSSEDDLALHKSNEHHTSGDVMYRCKVCSYTSKDRRDIYLHVKGHTVATDLQSHLCETCGQSFSTHSSLKRHLHQHSHGSTSCKKCEMCHLEFKTIEGKNKHICLEEKSMCERCGDTVSVCKLNTHACVTNNLQNKSMKD